MKAAILAGGYGKRLRPLTETIPKPLLPVGDKGIIEWQLAWLKNYGIEEIVVCAGYLKEKLMKRLGEGSEYGVKVRYSIEEEPLGTGGGLRNAEPLLKDCENFIVLNGDVLTDLDPIKLLEDLDENCLGSIALVQLPSPFGIIDFDAESRMIRSFIEKPRIKEYWINAGVYALKSDVFNYLPERGDIERTTFPALAEKGVLKARPYESCVWLSIDSHKDLEEASKIIPKLSIFKR